MANQRIYEEAAEWFVTFRENEADEADKRKFSQWLRLSPCHIVAYLEVSAFWEDVPQAIPQDRIDVAALIAEARAESNVVELAPPSVELARPREAAHCSERARHDSPLREDAEGALHARRPRASLRALVAASILAVCIAVIVSWSQFREPTFVTTVGEQRLITLADGSSVELNTRSKIRVRFTDERREIELLAGQALFRVEKDARRPFVVRSGDTRVRAIGTQFDVYRRSTGTVVTVLEGRVSVTPEAVEPTLPPAPLFLSAGERVTVAQASVSKPERAEVPVVVAWTQGQMVFAGTPLSDVVDEVNRYNTQQFMITDPALGQIRISGVFSATRPASLVVFLRERMGLEVARQQDRILISRPAAAPAAASTQ